ncbi:MAG: bifunctional riboflavin kinase/FAD synthetase [Firmicutes bacterium]|nr:bifunctional riboflavin kinase/FAD synthetase [Bacillota bacterium]
MQIHWWDGSLSDGMKGCRIVAGLGFFDGVHLGHQVILRQVLEVAATLDAVPAIVTFDRHPLTTIRPEAVPQLLTDGEERKQYLLDFGMKAVIELTFNKQLARLEPEQFASDILAKRLGVVAVIAGEDFRFGYQGRGGIDLLRKDGDKWGIGFVQAVDSVIVGDEKVSSTRIRGLLLEGMVEEAAELLGRPYKLIGPVVEGEGRGKKLGFPTANLAIPPKRLIPKDGVYAVTIRQPMEITQTGQLATAGELLGVLSVSDKPTFAGATRAVEVHILDEEKDYYGKKLEVSFHRRLRSIRKFANAEELQSQVTRDIKTVRELFSGQFMSTEDTPPIGRIGGPGEKIYSLKAL